MCSDIHRAAPSASLSAMAVTIYIRETVHGHRIGQVPGERTALAVAIWRAAVFECDALNATREVGRPRNLLPLRSPRHLPR